MRGVEVTQSGGPDHRLPLDLFKSDIFFALPILGTNYISGYQFSNTIFISDYHFFSELETQNIYQLLGFKISDKL